MLTGVPVPVHHSAKGCKHKLVKCFLYDMSNYHELRKYHSYNGSTLTTDNAPERQLTAAHPTVRSSLAVSSQKDTRFPVYESILQLKAFCDEGRLCTFEEHVPKMMLEGGGSGNSEHCILSLNLSSNKGQVPNLHSQTADCKNLSYIH